MPKSVRRRSYTLRFLPKCAAMKSRVVIFHGLKSEIPNIIVSEGRNIIRSGFAFHAISVTPKCGTRGRPKFVTL